MKELPEYPEYAERVLDVAELIPPGRVMTYGDVAEWLGEGGPRQVGRAMALYGAAVSWWRVVRADGVLLPGHEQRALVAYRTEGTPLRQAPLSAEGHLPRLDMKRARWDGEGSEGAVDGGHTRQLPPAAAGAGTVRPVRSKQAAEAKGRSTRTTRNRSTKGQSGQARSTAGGTRRKTNRTKHSNAGRDTETRTE
ncbi:MGMT family protein [Streptomyces albipurpureus]|uniref:MGMT family protein n=1 Tax=Streptomyces albipurpureus TaxID=2897419 RepID=A0ABT0UK75_9ACTN|nr:MGMT family protein [Streptomyces sp. CWNU-1]MCM2389044.1 MGMT family protein [Streptomyces sp. CWNU-1]